MSSDNTNPTENTPRFTPGPWRWAEQEFDVRYIKTDEDGNPVLNAAGEFKAKYPGALKHRWVYLLLGPKKPGVSAGPGSADEYDYPQVFALRWGDLKDSSFSGGISPENKALLAAAPELLAALIALLPMAEARDEEYGGSSPIIQQAKDAIAKAMGGSQ